MGRTMLRFKDMNDRQVAIDLLQKAHSLYRRGYADSVCDALKDAQYRLRTDNSDYNRRLIHVYNQIVQRIMGSLNGNTYVTSWLYEQCKDYWKWRNAKQRYDFNVFGDRRVRRYRQDWIADMIRTMRDGGFI